MKESNNNSVKAMPVAKRLAAAMCAAALAAATMGAPLAFADNSASATSGTPGSNTELKVFLIDPDAHTSNSDGWDALDNINLTYPTVMNYTLKHDGTLTGPTSNVEFVNNAEHATSVTALKVAPQAIGGTAEQFTFVDKASADISAGGVNQVSLQFGPSAGVLDLSDYVPEEGSDTKEIFSTERDSLTDAELTEINSKLGEGETDKTKAIVANEKARAWSMSYNGIASAGNKVVIATNGGKMYNVTDGVTNEIQKAADGVTFATVTWTVEPKAYADKTA